MLGVGGGGGVGKAKVWTPSIFIFFQVHSAFFDINNPFNPLISILGKTFLSFP